MKWLYSTVIICIVLFCLAAKSGWDRDILVPTTIVLFGSSLALGFSFGIGAKYLKLLLE